MPTNAVSRSRQQCDVRIEIVPRRPEFFQMGARRASSDPGRAGRGRGTSGGSACGRKGPGLRPPARWSGRRSTGARRPRQQRPLNFDPAEGLRGRADHRPLRRRRHRGSRDSSHERSGIEPIPYFCRSPSGCAPVFRRYSTDAALISMFPLSSLAKGRSPSRIDLAGCSDTSRARARPRCTGCTRRWRPACPGRPCRPR